MGYVIVLGDCFGCGRLFTFNPDHVPSLTPPGRSTREPICQSCVDRVNPKRIENGLAPIVVHPNAYEAEEV